MEPSLDNDTFNDLILTVPDLAIKHLYSRYYRALVQISERRTHNRKASEDIVQETFIRFWSNSKRLCSQKGFLIRPYLLSYVKKKSITWYHQSSKLRNSRLQDVNDLSATKGSKEAEILALEKADCLKGIVQTLPQRQRQCVFMRFFEEMSIGSISAELGISPKAVEKNITNGLKNLRNYRSAMYY